MPEMIDVENVHYPGKTYRRDAAKYRLAREAMLSFLPVTAPGMTQEEMMIAMRRAIAGPVVAAHTTSWWTKTVQLDLEAKGLVVRDPGRPVRWRRV